MRQAYRIFTLSPGSTSTKLGMFEDDRCIFSANVAHDGATLAQFKEIGDQFDYRKDTIMAELEKAGISLKHADAYAALSGGLLGLPGGTYPVNDTLLRHSQTCANGIKHPAMLGAQLVHYFATTYGGKAFVVDPPDVDEYNEISRVTGVAAICRESRVHALNQKEAARRYSSMVGKSYQSLNLIVAHMGGGISVVAHQKGRMIDANDCANGEGPMSPNRPGALPAMQLMRLCYSGKYTEKEMGTLLSKRAGLLDHLGTDDAREVTRRIAAGDSYAKLVYDAMIYQIAKQIGADAVALRGEINGIVLTGGMANDHYLVDNLTAQIDWIAPVHVFAGDFELDALAKGALRVLTGEEAPKEYTGIPVWSGFKK